MKRVCSVVWLLEVVLKDDFSLEIGLVDVEWASERACQPRKLHQHSLFFFFFYFQGCSISDSEKSNPI